VYLPSPCCVLAGNSARRRCSRWFRRRVAELPRRSRAPWDVYARLGSALGRAPVRDVAGAEAERHPDPLSTSGAAGLERW